MGWTGVRLKIERPTRTYIVTGHLDIVYMQDRHEEHVDAFIDQLTPLRCIVTTLPLKVNPKTGDIK